MLTMLIMFQIIFISTEIYMSTCNKQKETNILIKDVHLKSKRELWKIKLSCAKIKQLKYVLENSKTLYTRKRNLVTLQYEGNIKDSLS